MSTTSIGLRVTREQWRAFKAAAEAEGLTASDWVRQAAQERIEGKQADDRLAALDTRLSTALQAIARQLDLIHKKVSILEAAE
ncbi:plasmid mobilization protein [Methylocaldum gracile]|uniref:plasmid mobilization protein n=1 Tax=Methylocaldum sp. 0917 TaxID=2485163 RepID=UPI001061F505